jgi:hypothetical protein
MTYFHHSFQSVIYTWFDFGVSFSWEGCNQAQGSLLPYLIDGRIVGGEGLREKVHNREDWKRQLRTARNRRILHMPMEWMNEYVASALKN